MKAEILMCSPDWTLQNCNEISLCLKNTGNTEKNPTKQNTHQQNVTFSKQVFKEKELSLSYNSPLA